MYGYKNTIERFLAQQYTCPSGWLLVRAILCLTYDFAIRDIVSDLIFQKVTSHGFQFKYAICDACFLPITMASKTVVRSIKRASACVRHTERRLFTLKTDNGIPGSTP